MYCNHCGNYLEDNHRFCTRCGASRPLIIAGKKGTCWIPVLILAIMFAVGCYVYYVSMMG